MTVKGKIARYFKRQTGTRLNPLFSSAIECGAIVDLDSDGDVDFVGRLADLGVVMPAPEAPTTASFPEFSELSKRKFKDSAKLQLKDTIPLGVEVGNIVNTAKSFSVGFSEIVDQEYINVIKVSNAISAALEAASPAQKKILRRYLKPEGGNRVVGSVFTGTITLTADFSNDGSTGFKVDAYEVAHANMNFAWKRVNHQTLRSTTPVPFAFDVWVWRHRRLRDVS